MRRPLLAAAILVPAAAVLARIDTAPGGMVVDLDNYNARDTTSYINAAQCADTEPLDLEWSIVEDAGGLTGTGEYRLFAANEPDSEGDDANYCPERDDTAVSPNEFAGSLGAAAWTSNIQGLEVSGKTAADEAHVTCGTAGEGQIVYVCAHLYQGSTRKGYARGKFAVQVRAPEAPSGVQVGPHSVNALQVSWTEPSGSVEVDHYVAVATCAGQTFRSGEVRVGTSEATVSGLPVTDPPTSCSVVVHAYSLGGNESPASQAAEGTPMEVYDFWEIYAGRDDGGCGSGGTGPLALLALGLVALLRRRA